MKDINTLIFEQLMGQISEEDLKRLSLWIEDSEENREYYNELANNEQFIVHYKKYASLDVNIDIEWKKFEQRNNVSLKSPIIFSKRIKVVMKYVAAVIFPVIIILSSWLLLKNTENATVYNEDTLSVIEKSNKAKRNKAKLILPDGQEIELDYADSDKGKKMLQQNQYPEYSKTESNPNAEASLHNPDNIQFSSEKGNTLITYKDSEHWITFEDETKVHLNYNTTLTYPSRFGASDRTVRLEGEAFFIVAKDSKRPFRVITANGIIQQHGTSFNVNTLAPNLTKVVLVEGSISVITNSNEEHKINPGELAIMDINNKINVQEVDIEPYVAWNKGRFSFYNAPIDSIMASISKWFDMEVVFENNASKYMRFSGDIDRYESIEPILEAIEDATNSKITIQGKKIIFR